jgi:hypothetical protein
VAISGAIDLGLAAAELGHGLEVAIVMGQLGEPLQSPGRGLVDAQPLLEELSFGPAIAARGVKPSEGL